MSNEPKDIVLKALSNKALSSLLLGEPEYCYLPKWSPSSTNTDITVLWEALHDIAIESPSYDISDLVLEVVESIVRKYEGIRPVASILLMESSRKDDGRQVFDLPLDKIAQSLKKTIEKYKDKLMCDKNGEGWSYSDGLYGDLKRLNQNTIELGGPGFI